MPESLAKAKQYLKTQQQSSGGWGNSFSTSWALQAIAAFGESGDAWAPSGLNPRDYLSSLQQSDGGLELTSASTQNRVWATEYAIPASLGKHWLSLLQSFSKPAGSGSGTNGLVLGAATSTLNATTTLLIATSTPLLATSTPETLEEKPVLETQFAATTSTSTLPSPTPSVKNKTVTQATTTSTATTTTPGDTQSVQSKKKSGFFGSLWSALTSFFGKLF